MSENKSLLAIWDAASRQRRHDEVMRIEREELARDIRELNWFNLPSAELAEKLVERGWGKR